MFVDPDILIAYEEDYLTTVGAARYTKLNKQYCTEPAVAGNCSPGWKAGSDYIQISTKRNMLYGYGNGVEGEQIEVRRGDNAFKLQFILAMFFGTEFATIDKKELLVAKLAASSS